MKINNDLPGYGNVRYDCERLGANVRRFAYYSGPAPTFGGVPAPSSGSSSMSGPSAGELWYWTSILAQR